MDISHIFRWSCRILLASAFILSALLKLYPVEFFENDLLLHHIGTESTVVFASRLLIASELILAAGILFVLWDKLFLRLSFIMLTAFSLYLLIILILEGNSGNCGCFGNAIFLSPLEGIIKNIFFALLTFWLWLKPIKWPFRFRNQLILIIFILGIAAPFILNPIFFPKKIITIDGEKIVLPLEILYESEGEVAPSFDVRKGKKIIAFLLLGCEHCRLAAARMEAIKRSHPELPIYFVLCGEEEDLSEFIHESHLESVPYSKFNSLHKFMKLAGADFPAIYFVNDQVAEAKIGFFDIDSKSMSSWYNLP